MASPDLDSKEVAAIDWAVLALSAVLFFTSVAGGIFVAAYGGLKTGPRREFNSLWKARAAYQALGAAYALVQLLRLQVGICVQGYSILCTSMLVPRALIVSSPVSSGWGSKLTLHRLCAGALGP